MLAKFIDIVIYLVLLDAVLSWIMRPGDFPKNVTSAMLDPVYKPIRKLFGAERGGIDFSPWVIIIALNIIQAYIR